ncbi:MAG: Rab family GTPase, partial [Candidatus Hodarchaeales archaeon]
MWDIAGQSKFSHFRKLYYTGVAGVLLVYDITRKKSLEQLVEWNNDVQAFSPDVVKVLIGNKTDLAELNMREVEEEDRKNFAEILGVTSSIETSAKTGDGVKEAFELIA